MPALSPKLAAEPRTVLRPYIPTGIKFTPPTFGASQLPRPRLLEQLGASDTARLILIRAAAGFGKSTLLHQYHTQRLAQNKASLWVNLDATDNDLQRFVTTLAEAMQGLTGFERVVREPQELLEHLVAVSEPFALLLDEFEALHNVEVLGFVQQILTLLPNGCLIVIASRAMPGIGLGRLRARGQLLEIRPEDLRFTCEEAHRFLCDKRQLPLSDDDTRTLHRRTDGWITALYLASLSLAGREDHSAFIASFSGSHLELAEYLTEDVLARLSPECRDFLLLSSIADPFCPALCDALSGLNNGQVMIEQLERANLFLVSVDAPQHWYRYHPLFASFLRAALQRQDPQRAARLHEIAAHWFLAQSQPIPAIEHLFKAGHDDNAAQEIDRHLHTLLDAGRTNLTLRWLDRLQASTLDRYPAIAQAYALLLALTSRLKDATTVANRLVIHAGAQYAYVPDAILCLHLSATDQVDALCDFAPQVLARIPQENLHLYVALSHNLIAALHSSARHEEASRLMSSGMQREAHLHQGFLGYNFNVNQGILDLVQGRLDSALTRLNGMRKTPRHNPIGKPHDTLLALDVLLALVHYERGELTEAERLLQHSLGFVKQVSSPDLQIASHVLCARLALRRGDRHGWLRHLVDLQHLGEHADSQRMRCASWLERARVATLERQFDTAAQALRHAEQLADWDRPGFSKFSTDCDTLVIAQERLRIAQGNHGAALRALRSALDSALHCQHLRRALKLRLLLALALDGQGQRQEALEALDQALRHASQEGFVSPFDEEGERMQVLLQSWASQQRTNGLEPGPQGAFVDRLLRKPGNTALAVQQATTAPSLLTERESQVLRLLAAGHRNKVIASKIFLSECTVKSHLQKIYAKLEVNGRTEALAIARLQGWID
ncbi:LuxR C-terminal-related transcriptional regulator [Pseudomonas sp. H9]|uniref:LuxR C-terminal-related transcriptional regulator n=1 Tax=Pseudomonas sp. H9 TaxID=483968 RepID=UPI0010580D06|nr:LuxR C-terminal-related transcriptional regulator [Pseudomonas sp. H9]TDF80747.1 helix-turn-helix transcriptional regulator [Pseudomonas sp. H9]